MRSKRILVWFRNDLRLHDNEMLVEAVAKSDGILPVYFFDPRHFGSTNLQTDKTGAGRAKFLIESVLSLREAMIRKGGNLLVITGSPESHICSLVEKYDISEVYHHREVGFEETSVSANVEDALWKQKINLKHFIGHTLYNKEDLPFPIKDIPDVFSQFKKKTERDAIVKPCYEEPEHIVFVESEAWGDVPDLKALGFSEEAVPESDLHGGEHAGLQHLNTLLSSGSTIYDRPAKQPPGKQAFFSRLSPWLALGCLSPRKVYWTMKAADQVPGAANFNQVLLGLLWRDYYRFMFKKHGIGFFRDSEFEHFVRQDRDDEPDALVRWKTGQTGNALVDGYMNELNKSGYIPHAGRLVVATYLVYVLKQDWIRGAAYFEEKLVDYAPASNWGNWASVAHKGLNVANKAAFDLEKQIKVFDMDIADVA
ncbi:DASH family cryptochrome [Pedobacter faecalis]|uniref:DASH family cryptochrome n=1 Tax=Pedobacter faecalis TaxID=3041495 RepID=UPI00254A39DE|nr:DASH family cryptochrome [Pedobacter sp. ELA7]